MAKKITKEQQRIKNQAYYRRHRRSEKARQRKRYAMLKKKGVTYHSTERVRKWRLKNPEKNAILRARHKTPKEKRAIYVNKRRKKDVEFWLKGVLRCRINVALKKSGANKSAKTCDLIGCTVPELRAHLEKMFPPSMSWANRRLWHIDHIKPCAKFKLTDPVQQRLCFHYTNLQPLWAGENCRKGAK